MSLGLLEELRKLGDLKIDKITKNDPVKTLASASSTTFADEIFLHTSMLSRLKLSTDGRSRIARTARKKISSLAASNFLRDCLEHILKVDESAKMWTTRGKQLLMCPLPKKKSKTAQRFSVVCEKQVRSQKSNRSSRARIIAWAQKESNFWEQKSCSVKLHHKNGLPQICYWN